MTYTIRFHLGRENKGQNFMKWRVKNLLTGKIEFFDTTVSLTLTNCVLCNNKKQALKIFDGGSKTVCAYIKCESVVVGDFGGAIPLYFNPRVVPWWCDGDGKDLDGKFFGELGTLGRNIFKK